MQQIKKTKARLNIAKHKQQQKLKQNQNALNLLLNRQQPGYLIPQTSQQQTLKLTQNQIQHLIPIQNAHNIFTLNLQFGSYKVNYSQNGSMLLIGSNQGHVAMIDWRPKQLKLQMHLKQKVRDLTFLHFNGLFAVAQKKYVCIYDQDGVQIHKLRHIQQPEFLQYLPYHYLLVSVSNLGFITYQDISTGEIVLKHRTKIRQFTCLSQNKNNGIIMSGDSYGTISMFAPSSGLPVLLLNASRGIITDCQVSKNTLIVSTNESLIKLFDIRTYKELYTYSTKSSIKKMDVSHTSLLALAYNNQIQIWKDFDGVERMKYPYMKHRQKKRIVDVKFVPFEDLVGVGLERGFSSAVVPGAGQANFDYFQVNPFQTKKQRRQSQVVKLLEKVSLYYELPPQTIRLNPDQVGTIDKASKQVIQKERQEQQRQKEQQQKQKNQEKKKGRGRNKIAKKYSRIKIMQMEERRRKLTNIINMKIKAKRAEKQNKLQQLDILKEIDKGGFDPGKLLDQKHHHNQYQKS